MMDTSENARPKEATTQGGPVRSDYGDGGDRGGERRPEGGNAGEENDDKVRQRSQTLETNII